MTVRLKRTSLGECDFITALEPFSTGTQFKMEIDRVRVTSKIFNKTKELSRFQNKAHSCRLLEAFMKVRLFIIVIESFRQSHALELSIAVRLTHN
jgi:hypothetical protein